ncbi:MAG: polymerase, sigma subunit, SigV [Herbinix sp.]|nr:polymerase, sigma subunit, SigV [Herbinix sp.]
MKHVIKYLSVLKKGVSNLQEEESSVYDKLIGYILGNQNKFYRIAYCYVQRKEGALDIVQNAICKALEKYQTLKNENAIKTWFYRILINECLQYLNKGKREVLYEPENLKEEVYYEEAFEPKLEIYNQVCRLPEQMKEVVILHYFEQLTLKEISQITGVNLNTVKTRLYTAIDRLKKEVGEI